MEVSNPLQMNDWKIRRFLIVIFAVQFSMWGAIILDFIGLNIPGLRQLIGFIYLSFIPGTLILRILKLNNLSNIRRLLYTVGLSLSTLMFIGFFINIACPIIGISNPISIIPLILTISVIVIFLCIFCYFHTKSVTSINKEVAFSSKDLLSPCLLLLLIPLLSILGAYAVNYIGTNILLILMIFFIGGIISLIAFDKFIPNQLYPLAIWVISISLVLHYTLITNYAGVHDGEFGYAKLILENHIWKWNNYGNYNSSLSIVLLPPIFSIVCNMSLTWIFKIIFPLFLSFIPLGIYCISRIYLNKKMSFLSACIFLTSSEFFVSMSFLVKQTIATFFLVLLFMVLFDQKSSKLLSSILSLIFMISLIVSHYGTSYLVMVSFILLSIFLFLTKNNSLYILTKELIGYDNYLTRKISFINNSIKKETNNISYNFILLFFIFSLAWYIYISNSSVLDSILSISSNIWNSIISDFFSLEYSRGADMLTKEYTGLRVIHKYLKLGIIAFITLGFIKEIRAYRKSKFSASYLFFSMYYLLLMVASVLMPYFSVMSPGRLYILGLCFLSPLFVVGGLQNNFETRNLKILFMFVVILMLFNTQLIYVLVQDSPTSISIGQEYVEKHGDEEVKAKFYSNMIIEYDILSLEWLSKYGCKDNKLFFTGGYTHIGSVYHNMGLFPMNQIYGEYLDCYKELHDADKYQYIMLIYSNVVKNIGFSIETKTTTFSYFNFSEFKPLAEKRNKIYDNSGCEIMWNY